MVDNELSLPKLILSGSEDRNIGIWDVETGLCKGILRGHNHIVSCVAVYKELLVSASFDETIRLWDLKKVKKCICLTFLI